ncbi:MAG: efflux RND transporter permease subunit [Deltaproteobacteria bacterium]|nr:MAG: efflux RND transporter permease subunit [Deltaproteobacteria bacterium]
MSLWPKYAVSFRAVTIMAMVMCVFLGISSYSSLPKRDMPQIPVPVAQVITYYPGASALDVETLVTKKLEHSFSEIEGVETVTSKSKPGVSIITVQLVYGTPTQTSWDKLRNKVEEVKQQLPSGIQGPHVNDTYSDTAAMMLAVYGKGFSYRQLEDYSKQIRDELKRISSVGKVDIVGTQEQVIYLYARRQLTSSNIPNFWKVSGTLQSKNVLYPGAELLPGQLQVKLQTSGRISTVEQLKKIVLSRNAKTGQVVRVQDVFRVERTYKDPKAIIRYNGQRALVITVEMRERQNVIKMGKQVEKALKEMRSALPRTLQIAKVSDQPTLVQTSILNFMSNLFQAICIVLVVAMLFMGVRSGLIMATAIPLSILLAFTVMNWIKWDIQQISIAGLIIALGMLVDNAIVITDNIYAKLQEGLGSFEASWRGASEIATPVLMSTLTTVAVFFPLGLMPSISGDFIRSIPVVVGIVLVSSFLVAMAITPLMSYYLLKVKPSEVGADSSQGRWASMYQSFLAGSLRNPKSTLTVVGIAFLVTLVGFVVIGKEFFPKAERDMFVVDVWLPEGYAFQSTNKVIRRIEAQLKKEKDIRYYASFVGQGSPRFDGGISPEARSSNYAQLVIRTSSAKATPRLAAKLQKQFDKTIAVARVTVKEFQRGPSTGTPVQLRVYGEDLQVLRALAGKLKAKLRDIRGTYDITDTAGYKVLNMDIDVSDYRASLVGLDNLTVAKMLRTWLEGYNAGSLIDGDYDIPIVLRGIRLMQSHLGVIQNAAIPISAERTTANATLLAIAEINPRWDEARIDRRNNQRYVVVSSQIDGVLASSVLNQMRPFLKTMDIPVGYRVEAGGSEEKRSEGFKDLGNAMILGILLLLMLLVIQFNSFRHTAVILTTFPLSLIGAILGLFLTGNAFGFMAFLGIVSLCGVVVNNALILLDYVQVRLREGSDYVTALQEAGLRRMRPILLTTTTTIGGLVPLFLTGGAMWTPMAAVLIFGLLSSTLLTLVVVPCLYVVLVGDREQRQLQQPSES